MSDFLLYLRVWLSFATPPLVVGAIIGWLLAEYVL